MTLVQTFFSTTYSISQARVRLRLIRDYMLNHFFKNDKSIIQDPWLISLGDSFYQGFSENNVYENLKTIEQEIESLEPLVIYLTFDMPEAEINRLGVWLRENIKTNLVFDIKIDPALIAGAAFSWRGRYKDYSLKASIEDKKERIVKNIKSYIR